MVYLFRLTYSHTHFKKDNPKNFSPDTGSCPFVWLSEGAHCKCIADSLARLVLLGKVDSFLFLEKDVCEFTGSSCLRDATEPFVMLISQRLIMRQLCSLRMGKYLAFLTKLWCSKLPCLSHDFSILICILIWTCLSRAARFSTIERKWMVIIIKSQRLKWSNNIMCSVENLISSLHGGLIIYEIHKLCSLVMCKPLAFVYVSGFSQMLMLLS